MFGSKIAIEKDLLKKAREYSEKEGYSSVEEFVSHLIEREINRENSSGDEDEAIKEKLKGLGYIS